MTDLLTIREHKGKDLRGLRMAYVGDGNNMANSYCSGAAKVGIYLTLATPATHKPDQKIFDYAVEDSIATGGSVKWTEDPIEAVKNADVVVTDTWASMGQESEHDARKKIFAKYQINSELMENANPRAIVMHCLPAYRGEEITEEVFEQNADVIFDEAENRLHTQKAILALTMG